MNKQIKILRIFLYFGLLSGVFFLSYKAIVPSGQISYVRDFSEESRFIDVLKPLERTQPAVNGTQTITGGPVYFNLKTPRNFDSAKVSLVYRTSPNWPHQIIELGTLVDPLRSQYLLKPLENQILDRQVSDWSRVASGTVTLYQRQASYRSVEDFLNNLPNLNEVATYNYDLKRDFRLSNYQPDQGSVTLDWPLKGSYSFYTYGRDEDLQLDFSFVDIAFDGARAPTSLTLYEDGKVVKIADLKAQRAQAAAAGRGWRYAFAYHIQGEHLYKLDLRADAGLSTTRLHSSLAKLSFAGQLPFAYAGDHNYNFLTDSREVNLLAINSASLGEVRIGTSTLLIDEAYKQLSFRTLNAINKIKLTKSGLSVMGDGVFAPNEAALINPKFKSLNYLTALNREGINYILAKYDAPQKIGEWQEASAEFDLRAAQKEKGDYKFMISVPGFKNGEKSTDWLEIKEIKVDLRGQNWLEMLKGAIRRVIKRLI